MNHGEAEANSGGDGCSDGGTSYHAALRGDGALIAEISVSSPQRQ